MWTIKKKNQVSTTYAHLMSWIEEGCFPEEFFFLQRCKSNQKIYRGENPKWPILQG